MPFLPEPLKAVDTIGLITPSSPMFKGRLESGIAYLEQKGFKVKFSTFSHLIFDLTFFYDRSKRFLKSLSDRINICICKI